MTRWLSVVILVSWTTQDVSAVFIDCGVQLTNQTGNIASPNFPNSYPNDASCSWNITVAKNQIIDFRFKKFDLGSSSCSDQVKIYDGLDERSSSLIDYYCGLKETELLNRTIRSTSNHMFIKFSSDSQGTGQGFTASYYALDCPPFMYGKEICNVSCNCNKNNTHYCVNHNGACVCKSGWTTADCSLDIDECKSPNTCEDPYSTCVNTAGSFVCQCREGMVKDDSGQCKDSKQCTNKKCSHVCGLVISNCAYAETCHCPKGMQLDPANNQLCIECSNWKYGENCKYTTYCSPANTKSYNKTNGLCSCYLNYTSSNCTQDVDECSVGKSPCRPEINHAQCYNTIGSFGCTCEKGYEPVNETTCDACGKVLTASSGTIVSKTHTGSSLVECDWVIRTLNGTVISLSFQDFNLWFYWDRYFETHPAYIEIYDGGNYSSNLLAVFNGDLLDLTPQGIIRSSSNEMYIVQYSGFDEKSNSQISQGFNATYWSHALRNQCICKPGWTSADCSVDFDECYQNPLSCPDYSLCTNTIGSFQCNCKKGLIMNNGQCVVNTTAANCSKKNCSNVCVNLVQNGQNFEQCYCPIGMELIADKCVDCKSNKYGPDCYRSCECVTGKTLSCDTRTGNCTCLPLWKGKTCSIDYDVCTPYSRNECQKYANCTNTGLKGYRCRCSQVDGYIESADGSCVPINCSHVFTNSSGKITSPLYPSSYMNNAFCTWSIYAKEGSVISLRFTSGFYMWSSTCEDNLEVFDGENNSSRLIGQYCDRVPSVIRSRGNQMYVIFKSNWLYGGSGFDGTFISHECRNFTYGSDSCNTVCRCVKGNTEFCDNVNGECTCKPGWTLGDCSQDVNECLGTNNKVCPTNSVCVNTRGSYRCECIPGYRLNTTLGECEVSKECVAKKCSHGCYIIGTGNEKCTCPLGLVLDSLVESICVVPYYTYGKIATDLLLSDNYTTFSTVFTSSPIYFTFGAPYGNKSYPAAFVHTNGIISFGSKLNPGLGGILNLTYVNDKKLNIVAPFVSNINSFQGEVYYHLYEKCARKFSNNGNILFPTMEAIIERAERDINEYNNLSSFEIDTVLVVTWAGMQPYVFLNKTSEVNTFQALYISGWEYQHYQVIETAYVIFLYQYGLMNWSNKHERPIFIGTTGDYDNLHTQLANVISNMTGNTGYKGVMSYKVGHVTGPQQSCKKYLCDHAGLLTDPVYQFEKEQLYKCPCSLERLGTQWQLYEKRGDKNDIYCYAISMVAKQRLLRDNKRNKMCCYEWRKPLTDDWREWLQSWREATYLPKSPGSGHVLVNDPWSFGFFDNYQNLRAHRQCCNESNIAELCNKFYQIFPDMGCSNYAEFVPASALGDPHITTLDGVTYSMNGFHEYRMLEASTVKFLLQARTGRTETINGTLTNATVFIAFAARESNESSFQVELSPSKTSLVVLANSIDITNEFYKEKGPDIIVSTSTINVIRDYRNNKTLVTATFPCGVSITVQVSYKSLLIEVNVPKTLQNKTKGLLGNFNGNKNDEFMLPNGKILPANLNERQIYEQFAKQWTVSRAYSVFIYKEGENPSTHHHPEFIPMFMDETDPVLLAKAEQLCQSKNKACVYDYLATGDANFAINTKEFSEEMESIRQNLENNPPMIEIAKGSLDARGRWLVKEGDIEILNVNAKDVDNDLVTFEIVDNLTGISINQTGHLHFKPDISSPIMLRIRAQDEKGSYSPFLFVPLTICPSCNGYGLCDSAIVEEYEKGWFQVQTCQCYSAYTGKNCESELDTCEMNPCFSGQTCNDLTAEQQGNSSIGYKCGPCPTGYVAWMETCVDVDECKFLEPCEQSCTNTDGSYICSCREGYRLDTTNKTSCKDVNECEDRTSKCQQKCINNKGSYSCSCYSGYTLDRNGQTCTLDPSKQSLCYECEQVCQVINSNQVNCGCRIGYEVNSKDPTNCRDIDECQSGNKPCSHVCTNNLGAFECSCYTGYKLDSDQISCEACTSPYYGDNCANICQCNNRGSCDPVRGCVCNKQWTGVNCEMDVNECAQPNICPSGYICENTIGSYNCLCPNGFEMENGQCTDIDECSEFRTITCNSSLEVCVNNVGSYSCLCAAGYARNKQSVCQDIDECTGKINECEQICDNKPGTYNCQCYPGFILADDRKACIKVKEDCSVKKMNCSYGCRIDSNNAAVCYCPQGYKVNGLGQCEDINECLLDELNLCENQNGCSNTNGSYKCTCQIGSKLDNDGRTCATCIRGTWGVNCSRNCSCGFVADHCDPETGCVCKSGYIGTMCEVDIDECQTGVLLCSSKEKCVNTPGSAKCVCVDGYKKLNGVCQDVDECSTLASNNCSQDCTNIEGSFVCTCFPGYSYNTATQKCTEIDECSHKTDLCQQTCINTEGSYRCSCLDGLVLQPDGYTCSAAVQCVVKKSCSYQCASVNGTEKCFCPRGTVLAADGVHCTDMNLCNSSPCQSGCIEVKQNTSIQCICKAGQILDSDGFRCTDCVEGRWGVSCMNTCNCVTINTKHCDQVTGSCECKSGWSGATCDQDIDECKNTSICPVHTQCKNTDGGYICPCQTGYVKKSTVGVCEECDEGYFGQSCSKRCSCSLNSIHCDKTNGECYCKSGWNGTSCDNDIDECEAGTHTCDTGRHETCENSQGSFHCSCTNGYRRNCLSCACEDINECNDLPISPCEQTCTNLAGSYKCSCRDGFFVNTYNSSQCYKLSQYNISMTFEMNVTGKNLDDKNSDDYKKLKADIESEVIKMLQSKNLPYVSVTATNLRKGSLVADIVIEISAENITQLKSALQEILSDIFNVDNTQVVIIMISVNGTAMDAISCKARNIINPCFDHEECSIENNIAVCHKKKLDVKLLAIGLGIGIPLLVLLTVLVGVIIWYSQNLKQVIVNPSTENVQDSDTNKKNSQESIKLERENSQESIKLERENSQESIKLERENSLESIKLEREHSQEPIQLDFFQTNLQSNGN